MEYSYSMKIGGLVGHLHHGLYRENYVPIIAAITGAFVMPPSDKCRAHLWFEQDIWGLVFAEMCEVHGEAAMTREDAEAEYPKILAFYKEYVATAE